MEDVSSLGSGLPPHSELIEDTQGVRDIERTYLPFPLDPVLLKKLFDWQVHLHTTDDTVDCGPVDALSQSKAISIVEMLIERSYTS